MKIGAVTIINTDSTSEAKEVALRLPPQYHEYTEVFENQTDNALLQHKSLDHTIDLKEGTEALWGPIYELLATELRTLKEYQEEMLRTQTIRPCK
jgi:hypothetical protein